jgi:DNA-binding NarL/FixJ family response regulator
LIRIVVVEGQEEYRNYLNEYLQGEKDFEIVGSGSDSYEAVKLVDQHKPDILLMDMNIPLGDGIKTASLIKFRSPQTSVIIRGDGRERRIFSFFFSGISGYITKQSNSALLCHAIRAVFYGGRLVSPEFIVSFRTIATNIAENILKSRGNLRSSQFNEGKSNHKKYSCDAAIELPQTISPSEIQIMSFVGQGYTNKEIAEKLSLTEGTIRNYISGVLQKTGFRDRTQVAIYAVKAGL